MKPLVIVKRDYGQLGNRLHTQANALAWCIENNFNLINLSFTNYAQYFHGTNKGPADRYLLNAFFLRFFLRCPFSLYLFNRLSLSDRYLDKWDSFIGLIQKEEHDPLTELELEKCFTNNSFRTLIVRVWDIQCPSLLRKHRNKVLEILKPDQSTLDSVDKLRQSLPNNDFLVGIHARRGDYSTWLDGKHFHSWPKYVEWILQTKRLLEGMGRKPAYLLCSDEPPPVDLFTDLPVLTGKRPLMVDLHALSTCDLILGPPSSFSSWAAFYGNLPKICLSSRKRIQSLPIKQ